MTRRDWKPMWSGSKYSENENVNRACNQP